MLSKRLQSLTKYIKRDDKLIDIGCDHALLDIYLVKSDIVNNMIVSDVHENALQAGIDNIKLNKLTNKIDTRLGNGLNVLSDKDDVDTILISGMGSSTIIDILNHPYLKNIDKLIMQSNNDHELLRRKISSLGYIIQEEEYLIDKNKQYINIVFVKGNKKYTNDELKYGPILIKDKEYMQSLLNSKKSIINYIPKNKILLRHKMKKEINVINKYIQMT